MLLTALTFIIILSILVCIHEFGHYFVARLIGVHVEEFGFGLPPRIWGKKIRGTMYSVNWLPIGGFVRLKGEDMSPGDTAGERHKVKNRKTYFWARSKKERAAILLAGVTMNFLLAVGITTFLLTHGVIEKVGYVHIETVTAGSPAAAAGLLVDDKVERVVYTADGVQRVKTITVPEDLIGIVKEQAGKPVQIDLERKGEKLSVTIIPRITPPTGEGPMGVAISDLEQRKYSLWQAPQKALSINISRMWQMLTSIGGLLYKLATGASVQQAEVAGPVGIAQVTGQAVKYGWEAVLEFMSILSLNLALLNVLPFPALDGGRLAFVILEKFGKKARPDIERTIHQMGMIFLLALVALITLNDILRLVRGS